MKKSRGSSFKLLALLSTASVSVAPAALIGAASVLLAPATAMAANECVPIGVDPLANGATADSYVCSGSGTYTASGITYTAAGPLSLAGTSALNVGTVGINMAATGSDTLTWAQTTGVLTGTSGPVLEAVSATGAINITTAGITGTAAPVTYGILAVSTSGGITISDSGTVNVSGTSGVSAISASTSGAINITTTGSVTGRVFGIQATNTGNGSVTINANNSVSVNGTAGVAAIEVADGTGTGTVNVNVGGTTGTVSGSSGPGIRIRSNGTQNVTISTGRTVSTSSATLGAISLTGTGSKNITNAGSISAGSSSGVAILANSGSSLTLTNSGSLSGVLSISAITGTSTVTNSGTWNTAGTSAFSAGTSTLTNSGTLTTNGDTTFTSLENFNNSGTIALGTNTLTSANSIFTATGSSLITTNVTATDAGLLSLPGGTTSGVTGVRVSGISDTSVFSSTPIVLVDVTGGTTHAGDFVLNSGSTGFVTDPAAGNVIASSGSLFGYSLIYNGAQQHELISVPLSPAFEYLPGLQEVLSVWHTTADLIAGRQADLHDGATGGAWVRVIGEHTNRDLASSFTSTGNTFDFNTSYNLDAGALIAGFELGSFETPHGNFVLGVHGGLVRTKAEFGDSNVTDDMDGVTTGVYGGWASGPATFDATLNFNLLSFDHNGSLADTNTNVISFGGRAEAGYRMAVSEGLYIQPLITAAYVHSEIKDIFPGSYEINYNDVDSLRGAVGLRVGGDSDTSIGRLGVWLTGRVWEEFADEASVLIRSSSSTGAFVMTDDMSGSFEEVNLGVTLGSSDGGLQGFVSGGGKFQDDLDNYNASLGLRWRW